MGALASYPQELESGGDLSHQYQDTQLGKDAHRHTDWKGEWLLCAKVPGFSAAPLDCPSTRKHSSNRRRLLFGLELPTLIQSHSHWGVAAHQNSQPKKESVHPSHT